MISGVIAYAVLFALIFCFERGPAKPTISSIRDAAAAPVVASLGVSFIMTLFVLGVWGLPSTGLWGSIIQAVVFVGTCLWALVSLLGIGIKRAVVYTLIVTIVTVGVSTYLFILYQKQ